PVCPLWTATNNCGVQQQHDAEAELEQRLDTRMGLRAIGCRDGADRDEYRAGEQLTEDDADGEPDGLEPAAAHHRDRRGEAERAQGRNQGIGDQVDGRAQHERATPSRRPFRRLTLTILSLPARARIGADPDAVWENSNEGSLVRAWASASPFRLLK